MVILQKPVWYGATTCDNCPQIHADSHQTSACSRKNAITSRYSCCGIQAGYQPREGLCLDAKQPFGTTRSKTGLDIMA